MADPGEGQLGDEEVADGLVWFVEIIYICLSGLIPLGISRL